MKILQQDDFNENWMRQVMLDAESDPHAAAWDTPSDAVWAHVAAALEKKRRRRFALWWRAALVVAAFALMTLPDIRPDREQASQKQIPQALKTPQPQAEASDATVERIMKIPERQAPDWPQGKMEESGIQTPTPAFRLKAQYQTNVVPAQKKNTTAENFPVKNAVWPTSRPELPVAPQTATPFPAPESITSPEPGQLAFAEKKEDWRAVPVELKKRRLQWWAGFRGGPMYSVSSMRARQPGALIFRNQETAQWSSEQGLDLKIAGTSGWYVQAGMSSFDIRQQTSQVFRLRFERQRERQLPSGEWESTFALSVPSSFGESEAELDLRRDDNLSLQEGQAMAVEIRSTQALGYLSFHVGGGFAKSSGRWMYGAGAGIAFNLLQSREFSLTARARQAGIRLPVARIRRAFLEASSQTTDLEVSGWISYRLSPRWMLGMTPALRHSLSPMVRHHEFSTGATSVGLQLSVHHLL